MYNSESKGSRFRKLSRKLDLKVKNFPVFKNCLFLFVL